MSPFCGSEKDTMQLDYTVGIMEIICALKGNSKCEGVYDDDGIIKSYCASLTCYVK